MNPNPNEKIVWHFGINFVAACLLFVALVVGVKLLVPVPAINADRAAVRSKALADIRAAEATALSTPGWIDQDRNIVRLPIETAMKIIEQQSSSGAHADLIWRAEQATAPLPKTAPKPSAFE